MNYFTLFDFILMVSKTPIPRDHSANLDTIKTVYDKEFNQLNWLSGFFSGLALLILGFGSTVIIEYLTGDSPVRYFDIITGFLSFCLMILIIGIGVTLLRTTRLKRQFVELVREYFLVVPW
jgi:hypothetical protein